MAQKERLEQIRQIMQKERKVSVSELSVRLAVTPETIRRDLEKLEQESFLTRTHGGAVITQADLSEKISFLKRENTNAEAKRVLRGWQLSEFLLEPALAAMPVPHPWNCWKS